MNLGVGLDNIDFVFKVHWAVTLYLKLLLVGFAENAVATHIDEAWEKFILRGVDDGEGMDWN